MRGYLLICAMILSAGCAGYHLGPVNPGIRAGEKSIEIVPFNNQTLQPRLGDAVTQALRERLQQDGTYHLATHDAGDIIVTGIITRYQRSGISFSRTDVTTAQNYRVEISAHIIVRDRTNGKVLLDKNVSGHTLTQTGTDLAESERQSLPLLAESLARNIVSELTEGSW